LASAFTVHPLDCNNTSWFWLAWTGGLIQAGYGNMPGLNLIMEYTDPNPLTIRGVGVAVYVEPVIYSTYNSM